MNSVCRWIRLRGVLNLSMAARKSSASNNHLAEAMALMVRNQAAFVEQIARNDEEGLTLQRSVISNAGATNGRSRMT